MIPANTIQWLSRIGKRLCALVAAVVLGLGTWNTPAHAATFFENSFELPCSTANLSQLSAACNVFGSSGGFSAPTNMSISTTVVFSGIQSLHFHYVGTDSGGFVDQNFGALTEHLWIRFYYRPVNMTFNPVATKIIFAGNVTGSTLPNFWLGTHQTPGRPYTSWQGTADGTTNLFPNIGTKSLTDGAWNCVEVEAKMNTPGVTNGEVRVWIDGVLIAEHTGKMFRAAGNNAGFNSFRYFVQHGVGDTYYDLIAAGSTRIGCATGPPDTSPPSAPTNLSVQ